MKISDQLINKTIEKGRLEGINDLYLILDVIRNDTKDEKTYDYLNKLILNSIGNMESILTVIRDKTTDVESAARLTRVIKALKKANK